MQAEDLCNAILHSDGNPRSVVCSVILPFIFMEGHRYVHEHQQDAMSYVSIYGHPNLFITLTTNPNWPEIRDSLLPGQDPQDHPHSGMYV